MKYIEELLKRGRLESDLFPCYPDKTLVPVLLPSYPDGTLALVPLSMIAQRTKGCYTKFTLAGGENRRLR